MNRKIECWSPMLWAGNASPQSFVDQAIKIEEEGWDGTCTADSQCLMPDVFVVLTMVAMRTRRLGLGTSVAVPLTRHPAVMASCMAAIQQLSGGRANLGIGRGDTALAYLGASPVRLATFENFVDLVGRYLAGEEIPLAEVVPTTKGTVPGFETVAVGKVPPGSRLTWLDPDVPKVPVEVTATGPKALAMAGRKGDRVALNVGTDPARVQWAIDIVRRAAEEAGRDPASIGFTLYSAFAAGSAADLPRLRELVQPLLMAQARFSVMDKEVNVPASDHERAVLKKLGESYKVTEHVRKDQIKLLDDAFIDSYAVVGTGPQCVERMLELASLGIDRFIMPSTSPDRPEYADVRAALVQDVLPGVRAGA